MKVSQEVKTISDTIIWLAKENMKVYKYQNINSAVHSVLLDIENELMDFMKNEK